MKQLLIKIAFSTIEKLIILKIKNERYRGLLDFALKNIYEAAQLLTDGDPENEAQLKGLWIQNRSQLFEIAFQEMKDLAIEKIEDEATEALTLQLIEELEAEVNILIDTPDKKALQP